MDSYITILQTLFEGKEIPQDYKWQYPINNKFETRYKYENAQSLLEFSYIVCLDNVQNTGRKLKPPNFDIALPIDSDLFSEQSNILWLFYSTSLDIILLVFTGTYNYDLTLMDLNCFQIDPGFSLNNYVSGLKIHGGFWTLYNSIKSKLYKSLALFITNNTQILVTGFSLGGALSTIATLDLYNSNIFTVKNFRNIIHYSFASPRLFNPIGANHYSSLSLFSYRVCNNSDIITALPLPIMSLIYFNDYFQHVSKLINFDTNLCDYSDNHLKAYLQKYFISPIF